MTLVELLRLLDDALQGIIWMQGEEDYTDLDDLKKVGTLIAEAYETTEDIIAAQDAREEYIESLEGGVS